MRSGLTVKDSRIYTHFKKMGSTCNDSSWLGYVAFWGNLIFQADYKWKSRHLTGCIILKERFLQLDISNTDSGVSYSSMSLVKNPNNMHSATIQLFTGMCENVCSGLYPIGLPINKFLSLINNS